MEEFLEQREDSYKKGTALFKNLKILCKAPNTVVIPVNDGLIMSDEPLTVVFDDYDYRYMVECPKCGDESICWWRGLDSVPRYTTYDGVRIMALWMPWGKNDGSYGRASHALPNAINCPVCKHEFTMHKLVWYSPPLTKGDERLTTLCPKCNNEFTYASGYDLYAGQIPFHDSKIEDNDIGVNKTKLGEISLLKNISSIMDDAPSLNRMYYERLDYTMPDMSAYFLGSAPVDSVKSKAYSLYIVGKYEEALHECEKGLRTDRSDVFLLYVRGRTKVDLGRFDEAVDDMDSVLSSRPDDAEVLYEKAKILFSMQKYDEAISNALKASKIERLYYEHLAWTLRGTAMSNMGSYDEALHSFELAMSSKHGYKYALFYKPHTLVKKGNELLSKGNRNDALVCYNRALCINPDFKPATQAIKAAGSSRSAI